MGDEWITIPKEVGATYGPSPLLPLIEHLGTLKRIQEAVLVSFLLPKRYCPFVRNTLPFHPEPEADQPTIIG